jgi:hypothetical protein
LSVIRLGLSGLRAMNASSLDESGFAVSISQAAYSAAKDSSCVVRM